MAASASATSGARRRAHTRASSSPKAMNKITARRASWLVKAANARLEKRQKELARLEGIRDSAAFNLARYEDSQQDAIEADLP